jgi:hypothetical protein
MDAVLLSRYILEIIDNFDIWLRLWKSPSMFTNLKNKSSQLN